MINVDDRLIRKELKKIGVDAFAVLLCITSHLGKSSTAWPGIARLREMTGLSKEKAYVAIRKLIECGMVERKQENEKGVWGKVVYRVTTEYLNIYVPASAFALSEPLAGNPYSGNPEHGYPEHGNPYSGNPEHISIKEEGSINKERSINKEEGRGAPAQKQKKTIQPEQPTQTPPPHSAPPPSPGQTGARNAPSAEQMAEYLEDLFLQNKWQCRFVNNPPETAEQIHAYYSANGWRVGRSPMKDWQAACRNWLLNNEKYGRKRKADVPNTSPQAKRVVSEDTHRRALAITLSELGITGS